MITKVSGKANGLEITFEYIRGSRWEATVPSNPEGEYVVELYAENDAGNRAYICTALFAITGHEVQGYVVPRGFSAEAGIKNYAGFPSILGFLGDLLEKGFSGRAEAEGYTSTTEKGGYTIERAVCFRDHD